MLIDASEGRKEFLVTRTGVIWFLINNVVISFYLVIRIFFQSRSESPNSGVFWLSLFILFFSIWNIALTEVIRRSGYFVKRYLLLANVFLYGVLWAMIIHALNIPHAKSEFTILLSLLIIFPAVIAFHLSGAMIIAFCFPVLLVTIGETIIAGTEANYFVLFSYFIALAVILSSRIVLMEWFRKSEESEKQNALLVQKLTRLADRDSLTEMANKRYLREYFHARTKSPVSEHNSVYLIMIDVDFFKYYNDLYGHLAGDECLMQVAKCIKDTVRNASDLAARFGGEEFCVLLLASDRDGVLTICERIQQKIRLAAIQHGGSSISSHVTVSQGAAQLHPGESFDELISNADEQLYRSKKAGRNRIHISER